MGSQSDIKDEVFKSHLPDFCYLHADLDDENAGWWVNKRNAPYPIQIIWTTPGHGIPINELSDISTAFEKAILYADSRVRSAEKVLKDLKRASEDCYLLSGTSDEK